MKKRFNFQVVKFVDRIFFIDKEWLRGFLSLYKEEINLPFTCYARVESFDRETGELLKHAGCAWVTFGIESMVEKIRNDILGRFHSNAKIKECLNICEELKLKYHIDLIFGLPYETEQGHLEQIKEFAQLRLLGRVNCFDLMYFPKLRIMEILREKGILTDSDVEKINDGEIVYYYQTASVSRDFKKMMDSFKIFYSLLPLLPSGVVNFIIEQKVYRKFISLPRIFITILQYVTNLQADGAKCK